MQIESRIESNLTPDVKYGLFFIGSFLLQKCIVYTGEDEADYGGFRG